MKDHEAFCRVVLLKHDVPNQTKRKKDHPTVSERSHHFVLSAAWQQMFVPTELRPSREWGCSTLRAAFGPVIGNLLWGAFPSELFTATELLCCGLL
jgi:hypothetical protein